MQQPGHNQKYRLHEALSSANRTVLVRVYIYCGKAVQRVNTVTVLATSLATLGLAKWPISRLTKQSGNLYGLGNGEAINREVVEIVLRLCTGPASTAGRVNIASYHKYAHRRHFEQTAILRYIS